MVLRGRSISNGPWLIAMRAHAQRRRIPSLRNCVQTLVLVVAFAGVADAQKPPAAPARLLSELRSKDKTIRREAATQLGAMRARGAVRGLAEALTDREAAVREAAAFALGQIADPAATGLLIPLLADPDADVRASAAFVLGMIGNRKALQALSYAVGDTRRPRNNQRRAAGCN